MTAIFDKLNLRPHERRFVFAVGMLIFLVLNWLFIWPRFDEWRLLLDRRDKAIKTANRFQVEIANTPKYQAKLEELKEAGMVVPADLQDLELAQTIQLEAAQANIFVPRMNPVPPMARGNTSFFDEARYNIQFTANEKELVTFLVNLSTGKHLIRVRDLDLKPDPSGQKLMGTIGIVGSYPRKASAAAAGSAAKPAGTKPAPK